MLDTGVLQELLDLSGEWPSQCKLTGLHVESGIGDKNHQWLGCCGGMLSNIPHEGVRSAWPSTLIFHQEM